MEINGTAGNDSLSDTPGDDTINGLGGDDSISVSLGLDRVTGGDGFDTLIIDYGDETADVNGGIGPGTFSTISNSSDRGVEFNGFERYLVATGFGNDSITLFHASNNDVIILGGGNDFAASGAGDDEVSGGAGNDLIDVGSGDDSAIGGPGVDGISADLTAATFTIFWNLRLDSYSGPIGSFTGFEYFEQVWTGSGHDVLVTGFGSLDDRVDLGAGDDSVDVGGGHDVVSGGPGFDTLIVGFGHSTTSVTGGLGPSTFSTFANQSGDVVEFTNFERFEIATGSGNDSIDLFNGSGNDVISLGDGQDFAASGAGDDILDGGAGADTMIGGTGNDRFIVDNPDDLVIEATDEGDDMLLAAASYALRAGASVEVMTTVNAAVTTAINLTGNELGQSIYGNAGNNILNGGGGADNLVGLGGNDSYVVDSASDAIVEAAGEGDDMLLAAASYVLGAGVSVEVMTSVNAAATIAIDLTGNDLGQSIYGNAGNNLLNGGGGADYLVGLGGNDTYVVDSASDTIVEAGEGDDMVLAGVSYALGAGVSVEVMTTANASATTAINLTGNELGQSIYGNAGSNILTGGAGNDNLVGLGGNDFLVGGAGNDNMAGGLGNDIYYLDAAGDAIFEAAGEGDDVAVAFSNFALGSGAHVETLAAAEGSSPIELSGNELGQSLYGNAVNNVLDGRGGVDYLVGGGGSDLFAFTTAPGAGNIDVIGDFQAGLDRVGIDNAVFGGLDGGALPAGAFRTGTSAQDADDRIIYDPATGALWFDADGNGAGAAVQFAQLQPNLGITSTDFVVT